MLFIDWLVFDLIAYEAVIVALSITFYFNLFTIATIHKLSWFIIMSGYAPKNQGACNLSKMSTRLAIAAITKPKILAVGWAYSFWHCLELSAFAYPPSPI